MHWAANRAAANIAVSRALADIVVGWGVDPSRVHVLRNGVDGDAFLPVPRETARAELSVRGSPVLLTVGNLVRLKRQEIAIETLAALTGEFPRGVLLVVGQGSELASLRGHAQRLGVADRVRFVGSVAQSSLPTYYGAADLMLLPSEREGWPNVVLESLACGTPVVASNVGGLPEILRDPSLGALVDPASRGGFVEAAAAILRRPSTREALRAYALEMGWQATTEAQLGLFELAAASGHASGR
jgi:glycosyltransferase involved in cell wall biosynthesis